MTDVTQNQQRVRKRAEALRTLVRERGLLEVLDATEKLWADGLEPKDIRIRILYLRNRAIPDTDLWSSYPWPSALRFGPAFDERRRPADRVLPPMVHLILSQGVALKFHLVAMFVAQCQAKPGRTWGNSISLGRRGLGSTSWLDLMAVSANSGIGGTQSAYTSNKLRQFRSALSLLSKRGLVDIGMLGVRDRYEGFRLLAEDGRSSPAGVVDYRVPREDEDALRIPVEFFTRGWVHVLTKSEIAAYLMWLQLSSGSEYRAASWKERAGLFGLSRDVYDTSQALEAYRLIDVLKPRERRGDGTWRGFSSGAHPFSNRIRVNPHGLRRMAHDAVGGVLQKTATLGKWSRVIGE